MLSRFGLSPIVRIKILIDIIDCCIVNGSHKFDRVARTTTPPPCMKDVMKRSHACS